MSTTSNAALIFNRLRLKTMRVAATTAAVTLTALLVGCSTSTPSKLSAGTWCQTIQEELRANGVGWPVANAALDEGQIDATIHIFGEYAPRADGILGVAASGWLQGFVPMSKYLLSGDHEGFERNVSEDLRQQLFLANVEINNQCGWLEWE